MSTKLMVWINIFCWLRLIAPSATARVSSALGLPPALRSKNNSASATLRDLFFADCRARRSAGALLAETALRGESLLQLVPLRVSLTRPFSV